MGAPRVGQGPLGEDQEVGIVYMVGLGQKGPVKGREEGQEQQQIASRGAHRVPGSGFEGRGSTPGPWHRITAALGGQPAAALGWLLRPSWTEGDLEAVNEEVPIGERGPVPTDRSAEIANVV